MIVGLAFRNVLRNKERSLLTLVGVVLAIGSFVALVSLAAGFTQRVEQELGDREVHIYVTGSRTSTLPVSPLAGTGSSAISLPNELNDILQVEGVRTITPVMRTSLDGPRSVIPVLALPFKDVEPIFKGAQFSTPLRDLSPQAVELDGLNPQGGEEATSTPDPSPSASPSPEATPALESQRKSLVYPVLVGQGLRRDVDELLTGGALVIEEIPFAKGAEMGSHGFLDYSIIAPIEAFFEQRPDRGVHEYWLTVDDPSQVLAVRLVLEARIAEYLSLKQERGDYAGARSIRVLSSSEYLRSAREYLGYGWLLQVAVSMVGVLIAVTASMNTMLMSTYERLGEYATLRAVGASRRVISLTILYEAIFLNVTGGVIGLAFGYLATGVLDKAVALILEIPYPLAGVTPALLLQALGLSFCVGVAGAIIPCFIVSRIDLVEQLRKGL